MGNNIKFSKLVNITEPVQRFSGTAEHLPAINKRDSQGESVVKEESVVYLKVIQV